MMGKYLLLVSLFLLHLWGIVNATVATTPNGVAVNDSQLSSTDHISIQGLSGKALENYNKAVEGDPIAQYELAYYILSVNESDSNMKEALYWARKSAYQDFPPAIHIVAQFYEDGYPSDEYIDSAQYLFKKAYDTATQKANNGDVYAMTMLGQLYESGEGPFYMNKEEAFAWYRKAAELNHTYAQYCLGRCYLHGIGVEPDSVQGVKWFQRSAEQGVIWSQYDLGRCYESGIGIQQDHTKAAYWYRKAAEQGDIDAQRNLGILYAKGEGLRQDGDQAIYWFTKAAERGDASSQYNLGTVYYHGIGGVKMDMEKAISWFIKAANQDNLFAQNTLAECYRLGTGVQKDEQQAFIWYKKAAEHGDADAQFSLACCYYRGEGTPKDEDQGLFWLRKAASNGCKMASEYLEYLGK